MSPAWSFRSSNAAVINSINHHRWLISSSLFFHSQDYVILKGVGFLLVCPKYNNLILAICENSVIHLFACFQPCMIFLTLLQYQSSKASMLFLACVFRDQHFLLWNVAWTTIVHTILIFVGIGTSRVSEYFFLRLSSLPYQLLVCCIFFLLLTPLLLIVNPKR